MWVEEIDEFFKGYLPFYVLIFLPILIIMSPVNPVSASHEFPVYRMQHFDLHGTAYGSRNAFINLEARSLKNWKSIRHCVVAHMKELSIEQYREIRSKAGALLLIVPDDISTVSLKEQQHMAALENAIMSQEVSIPIYFIKESRQFESISNEIAHNVDSNSLEKTATDSLISSIYANGYQVVISPGTPTLKKDMKISTIQGQLFANSKKDEKISTIVIVAHYDAFGIAPELSYGADSNGSGMAILLELVRLFSELYEDPKTHGKFNIIFLMTGAGKMNFMGSKKWLEDQLDSLDGSIVQDAAYVICLDTLASSDSLYMHVSKPPKEGTPTHALYKEMKTAAENYENVTVEGVHKKINLAEDILAWEHERYSIRRLPAFTLSTVKNHRDSSRNTFLDVKESLNIDRLVKHTKIIAEAIARQIYEISNENIMGKAFNVEKQHIEAWIDLLASQPRSTQVLADKDNNLMKILKEHFEKYLIDTKIHFATLDKRDPEFNFYDVTKSILNIYSVKPAVFDLVLTLAIVLYLLLVFIIIQKFSSFYNMACLLVLKKKKNL